MSSKTPGQSLAAVFSTHSVNEWKPARIVLMGIAGSLASDRLRLGDVVVPDTIYGYEVGDAVGRRIALTVAAGAPTAIVDDDASATAGEQKRV